MNANSIIGEVENPEFAMNAVDKEIRTNRLEFYLKRGFRDTGVRTTYFEAPFIVLEMEQTPVKYKSISGKHLRAMRMRLLTKETIGMVNAITGEFEADFWLEGEKNKVCRLYLMAETRMNLAKKKELIDASSDKKNSAYKGFMGKIRETRS